jgi:hypothetical protein
MIVSDVTHCTFSPVEYILLFQCTRDLTLNTKLKREDLMLWSNQKNEAADPEWSKAISCSAILRLTHVTLIAILTHLCTGRADLLL